MTYEEARTYIANVSKTGSILGLESIQNLMDELSNVQEKLSIIHIAGTNGKGSVGAFLESVLMEAGKKVGRYTSPAVFEPLEVWRINQKNISEVDYADYVEKVKTACDRMTEKGLAHPTVFEVETALAFLYFYEKKCDYVLLEVGMGGKTDATNLIAKPVCSVITSISMDHMQFLGSTLTEIASVKAGIIKENCPVVTIRQKEEVMQVIADEAGRKKAKLLVADATDLNRKEKWKEDGVPLIGYHCPGLGEIELGVAGEYQMENSYLAITVLQKVLGIPDQMILSGIADTRWPGRFEPVAEHPLFLLDGAHNEDAAEKLRASLQKYFTNRKITYIIGVLADKEHEKMLQKMLPLAERVYAVTPNNARALDGVILAEEAHRYHTDVTVCETISQAVKSAYEHTAEEDVILAFGSLSYLGELKLEIKKYLQDTGRTGRRNG